MEEIKCTFEGGNVIISLNEVARLADYYFKHAQKFKGPDGFFYGGMQVVFSTILMQYQNR